MRHQVFARLCFPAYLIKRGPVLAPLVPIYEKAVKNHESSGWRSLVMVQIPPGHYDAGNKVGAVADVSTDAISRPDSWINSILPPKLTTLAEFKKFWNRLDGGVPIFIPVPTPYSTCHYHVEVTRIDGSDASSKNDLRNVDCLMFKVGFYKGGSYKGEVADIGRGLPGMVHLAQPKLYFSSEDGRSGKLMVVIVLPLDKAEKNEFKSVQSVSEINVLLFPVDIGELDLPRGFFEGLRVGDFANAFPELNFYTSAIPNPDFDDVRRLLNAPPVERYISILGFSVPMSQLSKWGPLILLSLQLYFWLHLHELVTKIEPGAEGWNVAWIGLYVTGVSFAVAVMSSCVLPVIATVTLTMAIQSLEMAYFRTSAAAVVLTCTASIVLGILTGRKLYQLRKSARQASIAEPDTDPV
jgi:hypothetical protein